MAEQEYLSIKEVAERIGLGYEATRKKLADDYPDRIPSLGFVGADGKTRRRIPVEGFEEWLRAHESGGSVTSYPKAKLMYAQVKELRERIAILEASNEKLAEQIWDYEHGLPDLSDDEPADFNERRCEDD